MPKQCPGTKSKKSKVHRQGAVAGARVVRLVERGEVRVSLHTRPQEHRRLPSPEGEGLPAAPSYRLITPACTTEAIVAARSRGHTLET